jgi:hypothetical protein
MTHLNFKTGERSMTYSSVPLSFWSLVKQCFVGYVPVLRKTWPYILILSLLSFIAGATSTLTTAIALPITIVSLLIIVFLYGWTLVLGHAVLEKKPITHHAALSVAKKRYLPFLGSDIVLSIVKIVLFFSLGLTVVILLADAGWGNYLNLEAGQISLWWAAILFVLMLVFLVFTVILYVAPAIVMLDNKGIVAAFRDSAHLVKKHWWRVFGVLLIVHLVMLLIIVLADFAIPTEQVIFSGLRYFIRQFLIYPLLVSTILMLLNELKLRKRKS